MELPNAEDVRVPTIENESLLSAFSFPIKNKISGQLGKFSNFLGKYLDSFPY